MLVFLTPLGGLAALAAVFPLVALAVGARRLRVARASLGLTTPPPTQLLPKLFALAVVPALLGLAAAQPALRHQEAVRVRTDAEALFVLDTSRSMLAAKGPAATTRLSRAKSDAIAIRTALAEVPSGVATFTDRVLPALLPSPDLSVFGATVQHAVAIEQPAPANVNVTSTTLSALGVLGTGNYFPASARKRLVVVLTDGESRPFDSGSVARALAHGPGITLVLVHVWSAGEAVYDGSEPEQGYHLDPSSAGALAGLAGATRGEVFGEHDVNAVIRAAKAGLGTGPTRPALRVERTRSLAPFVVLIALVLLLALACVREWRALRAAALFLARRA